MQSVSMFLFGEHWITISKYNSIFPEPNLNKKMYDLFLILLKQGSHSYLYIWDMEGFIVKYESWQPNAQSLYIYKLMWNDACPKLC